MVLSYFLTLSQMHTQHIIYHSHQHGIFTSLEHILWCSLGQWKQLTKEMDFPNGFQNPQWILSISASPFITPVCGCAQLCAAFCNPMNCSTPGSSVHGIFLSKNTGMGCYFLLQGISLTQGSKTSLLSLLHWQVDSSPLSHLGSPWSP